MSFRSKRELLAQVAPRYQQATHAYKSVILDEFVAATGYARKYAILLLTRPPLPAPTQIRRPRAPRYGAAVQAALEIAWTAANCIGTRRLVPFLPKLVPLLERHGHLTLTDTVREQLLAISPATAERLLQPARAAGQPRGISTTKAGTLLKRQIPIRTFAEWDDASAGFFEADLVAHCGGHADGAFLSTLVLTDVATGWVECQALLYRSQDQVLQGLKRARQLIPFPVLGLDTDNGGEFINAELVAYCEQEQISFTRSRTYEKNDQCFVEQKNGAVVRQFVGYDRYQGEAAYRQLVELYRALRLYVNFFQPSLKLKEKHRQGTSVRRTYHPAQTPCERLCGASILSNELQTRLEDIFAALDPLRLLDQIGRLQEALWQHAVVRTTEVAEPPVEAPVRFAANACGLTDQPTPQDAPAVPIVRQKRAYRRKHPQLPRWWRSRVDPFAEVWTEIEHWLEANPARTAKSIFVELQQLYPNRYPDVQLRTLQRRIARWRATMITTFDDQWLQEEVLADANLPRPLRAVSAPDTAASASPLAAGQMPADTVCALGNL
jgi:hypothetical protein